MSINKKVLDNMIKLYENIHGNVIICENFCMTLDCKDCPVYTEKNKKEILKLLE